MRTFRPFVALPSLLALSGCVLLLAQRRADQYSVADLQSLILEGIRPHYQDACWAGPLWAAVDRPVAGKRLDHLLTELGQKSPRTARENVCLPELANARLIALARTGRLDLTAELRHPIAVARATALRHAVLTGAKEHSPRARELLEDGDEYVRREALDAVVQFRDAGAVPTLRAMVRRGELRVRACAALSALGEPEPDCAAAAQGGLIGSMVGEPPDPCREAQEKIASPNRSRQIEGLLYLLGDRFDRVSRRYDRLLRHAAEEQAQCDFDPQRRDRLLFEGDAGLRAVVAAIILWDRHPPAGKPLPDWGAPAVRAYAGAAASGGGTPSPRRGVRSDDARECTSDLDCGIGARCLRPEGSAFFRGVCGRAVDASGLPSPSLDRKVGNCWSDFDCPMLFRCQKLNALDGVCVKR